MLRKDFNHINVIGDWSVNSGSQLLIGNHVSWWDGFWVYYLNKSILRKRLYVMMLKDQLQTRGYLSRIGAYSVCPGCRTVTESLHYTIDLLKKPGNLVVMYPQGQIASFSAGVLPFQKGVETIVRRSGIEEVFFYAAMVDYFSERKPTLNIYLGQSEVKHPEKEWLTSTYRDFYNDAVQKQSHLKQ